MTSDRGGALRRLLPSLLVLSLLLAGAMAVYGDSSPKKDYALVTGTVWGPDQRPLAGIPLEIRRVGSKKPVWQRLSDRRGEYAVRLPNEDADYVIEAQIKVPKGKAKPSVTVHVERDAAAVADLHIVQP